MLYMTIDRLHVNSMQSKKLHQVWRLIDFRMAELNIANQKPIGRHPKRSGF